MIRPTDEEYQGLKEIFRDASKKGYKNIGFYYFCTKIDDPNFWIVLIKSKPNQLSRRIILGSITDKNSRIMKIWDAVLEISKKCNGESFIRKSVENIEQKACGNNRQPSRAAFQIFVHLRWLKIVKRGKRTIYYKLADKT